LTCYHDDLHCSYAPMEWRKEMLAYKRSFLGSFLCYQFFASCISTDRIHFFTSLSHQIKKEPKNESKHKNSFTGKKYEITHTLLSSEFFRDSIHPKGWNPPFFGYLFYPYSRTYFERIDFGHASKKRRVMVKPFALCNHTEKCGGLWFVVWKLPEVLKQNTSTNSLIRFYGIACDSIFLSETCLSFNTNKYCKVTQKLWCPSSPPKAEIVHQW